jgi:hypothetical protein
MQFREYEPALGIFTTPDPLSDIEHYVYAQNNPLKFHDPLGLSAIPRRATTKCEDLQNRVSRLKRHVRATESVLGIKKSKSISDLEKKVKVKMNWIRQLGYDIDDLRQMRTRLDYGYYGEIATYWVAGLSGLGAATAISAFGYPLGWAGGSALIGLTAYLTTRAGEINRTNLESSTYKEKINQMIMAVNKRIIELWKEKQKLETLIFFKEFLEKTKQELAQCEKKLSECNGASDKAAARENKPIFEIRSREF